MIIDYTTKLMTKFSLLIIVFSRVLRNSTIRFVGLSVGLFIRPSVTLYFLAFMGILALLLLPKYFTDLKYIPCPLARDWVRCVSGLVS